jgi:ribonuclease HI
VTTNNAAEWHALLAALARAEELGAGRLDVLSDSRLVVRGACRIAKGHGYRGASERLRTLAEVAGLYISCLRGFSIAWIPREQNWRADRLARRASAESRLVGLREAKGFK